MAKKRKAAAAARGAATMTTLIYGEEGIHPTTLHYGEEIHPTTLAIGEEGPTYFYGEHPPSNPLIENPSNLIAEQFGPITDPGGPVERQARAAVKSAPKRRKKRL